jgi:hypothetical protein
MKALCAIAGRPLRSWMEEMELPRLLSVNWADSDDV